MRKFTVIAAAVLFLSAGWFSPVAGAEIFHCSECGMVVDMNSNFIARMEQGGTKSYFCDIGDLFSFINRTGASIAGAEVRDFETGKWLDAQKTFYVRSHKKFKTPMGWGIAAFEERTRAGSFGTVLNFVEATETVK